MAKTRVGIAGCGDVAQHTYLPNLTRMDHQGILDFTAVCDIIPERAYDAQQRYGVPLAYTSLDEMLAEADIDLMVNLTPTQEHAECIMAGIAAHKHVYTEKPIATSVAEADEIIERGKAEGVVVAGAPAVMTHPEMQDIKAMIAKGQIGKVCFARAHGSHPGPDRLPNFLTDPTWFYKPGAGPIIDLGVYHIQGLTGILGPAKKVTAVGGIALPKRRIVAGVAAGKEIDVEVEDNCHLILDFGDACYAYIDATFCVLSAKGPRMEIYGSTGVINANFRHEDPPLEVFLWDQEREYRGWSQPEKVYRGSSMPARGVPAPPDWSLASGVEHVVHCLAGEEELILTAEHARHTLEIMLGAMESMREERTVALKTTF